MAREKKGVPEYRVYSPPDLQKQWFVSWWEEGKRHRKYGAINTYTTFEDRMQAAEQLIQELRASYLHDTSTFQSLIQSYLERTRGRFRKRTHETVANRLLLFAEMVPDDPTPQDVKKAFDWLQAHRSPTTASNYRINIHAFLKDVDRLELLDLVPPIKEHKTPARYFQQHQVRRLTAYMMKNDWEMYLWVSWMYYCLVRPAELRLLRVGDILMEEKQIRIPGSISKNKKTEHVAIPFAFWPLVQREYQGWEPGRYLFPSPRDKSKPRGEKSMTNRHRQILRALGFTTEYKLYSWKHTGAVAAIKAGITPKELQLQLRHHSLDEVDGYLRQLGVQDLLGLQRKFPAIDGPAPP